MLQGGVQRLRAAREIYQIVIHASVGVRWPANWKPFGGSGSLGFPLGISVRVAFLTALVLAIQFVRLD